MLEKLFESLDEKVFTPEMKDQLEEQFVSAVNEKAEEIAADKVKEKTDEVEKVADDYKEKCDDEVQEKIDDLEEKANEYVEMRMNALVENIDKYLDMVVENFTKELSEQLISNVDNAKCNAMNEAFSKFVTLTGVEVADIVKACRNSSGADKLAESKKEINSLAEENMRLKDELRESSDKVNTLLKAGLINEISMENNLSAVQQAKFEKLAEMVDFENPRAFSDKLDSIVESVVDGGTISERRRVSDVRDTLISESHSSDTDRLSRFI